jgi:GT2 family glycosyltransferase
MSTTLDIIIVNYNSTRYSINLIKSIKNIDFLVKKIIVIDNNSKNFKLSAPDSSKVEIIRNKKNLGFATAVNQGIKKSKSKFILLLNPDTLVVDNSIKILLKSISNDKKIGAIGGKLIYPNKKEYLTANNKPTFLTGLFEFTNLKKIFPNNKITKNFWIEKTTNITKQTEVASLCGAFILFRKKNKKTLNLFDENFFLYLEDLDFCVTLKNKGYKIIFDPRSKIKHFGGKSNSSKYNTVLKDWYKSRKYFFKKHLNIIQYLVLKFVFSIEELFLKIYHKTKNEPTG